MIQLRKGVTKEDRIRDDVGGRSLKKAEENTDKKKRRKKRNRHKGKRKKRVKKICQGISPTQPF